MSTEPVPPKERSSRFPFHYALLLVAVPALMVLLGLVLGTGPVATAAMALIALAVVFAGVGFVMRRRGFERRPGRHPVPPPSAS